MRWTISSKFGAAIGFALLALVTLAVPSYISTENFMARSAWVTHTYRVLGELDSLLSSLQDAETGERGFIITGVDSFLEPYNAGIQDVRRRADTLRGLVSDNPSQVRRLETLAPLIEQRINHLGETIVLRRTKGFDQAGQLVASGTGKRLMDQIRSVIKDMKDEEAQLLRQREMEANASAAALKRLLVGGSILAFVVLVVAGFLFSKSISGSLREGVAQLSSSASEILAMTSQVASSSAETATAVSQTSTTVEEVKQTAHLSQQKAKFVSEAAQRASQASQAGKQAVDGVVAGMRHIQEQMATVAESIVRLSEQSQAVGEIIAAVNDLADQSNLLAVNAAIEAARAGEQGKSFAVVAQEVKSLADQSKQATTQVRAILGEIQKAVSGAVMATEQGSKAVDSGVRQSQEAGQAISVLAESIAESAQAATQIAASSQQQLVGMDQVALAMGSIQQATSQNVAGTKQAEQAAQRLTEVGRHLRALVETQRT